MTLTFELQPPINRFQRIRFVDLALLSPGKHFVQTVLSVCWPAVQVDEKKGSGEPVGRTHPRRTSF